MSKTWKKILVIGGIVIALLVVFSLLRNKDRNVVKITAEKAAPRSITETVSASGQIYPEFEVKISPDISGEVTDLRVQEGDSVTRGQVLATIYADIYALQRDEAAARVGQAQANAANSQAALGALKAALNQAQQAYDRNKKLFDEKVISRAEFEQFETQLSTATANYNASLQNIRGLNSATRSSQTSLISANKNLSRATIVSPISGIVSSLKIEKGERVVGTSQMAGTEMMTVADMNTLEVRVNVGENDIVKVSVGDAAEIEVDAYSDRKFKGYVTKIASSVKSSLGTTTTNDVTNYEVRVRIDKSSYQDLLDPAKPKKLPFRPGMNARVNVQTKRKDGIISVPIAAVNARIKGSDQSIADGKKQKQEKPNTTDADNELTNSDMEEVVFVIQKDGTVKKRIVKSGIQDINNIEIQTGLKAGEEVVTGPYNIVSQTLKDGTKVKVVTRDELYEKK